MTLNLRRTLSRAMIRSIILPELVLPYHIFYAITGYPLDSYKISINAEIRVITPHCEGRGKQLEVLLVRKC
jgi:hypothetical protein